MLIINILLILLLLLKVPGGGSDHVIGSQLQREQGHSQRGQSGCSILLLCK